MSKVNQNHTNNIKKILLNDDIALVGITGELNRFNNCLPELSYHDTTDRESNGYLYILDSDGKIVSYSDILIMCEKKNYDIIQAMLQYYSNIDVNCSELEDYMIDNELV